MSNEMREEFERWLSSKIFADAGTIREDYFKRSADRFYLFSQVQWQWDAYQAATAAAEAKYRPVVEKLVEALKETKSRTVYYSDYGLGVTVDKALAIAAPLVGGK